ncbi:MAG: hypothetical protein AAB692_05705 [Patescibacteria group bacterium]
MPNWKMLEKKFKRPSFLISSAVLAVALMIIFGDKAPRYVRVNDAPPAIEFTWTPNEPARLEDIRGHLAMHDDYALDFMSYRLRVVEIDKTVDLPIDGLIGSSYEQDIYLGLLKDKPGMAGLKQVSLEFSIADDSGQVTRLVRVIPLR